jgi:hypothetical protein
MNAEAERAIVPELSPGEKLIWTGRPARGLKLAMPDILMIPFSLLWCAFALVGARSMIEAGGLATALGLAFVAIGIYCVVGRFLTDALRRSRTFYALTAQRVIIRSGILTPRVISLDIASLGAISLSERKDRSGTLTLGAPVGMHSWAAGMISPSWPGASRYLPPSFEMVENVRAVHDRIRSLRGH